MSTTHPSHRRPAGAVTAGAGVPPGTNLVVLRGVLSRDPQQRDLPSGDVLVAYEVTVAAEPAVGRRSPARAESVPVVWLDAPAVATALAAGDDVVVVGRVRRRFFRAGGTTASRTEVVADRVEPARLARRVCKALDPALARLDETG